MFSSADCLLISIKFTEIDETLNKSFLPRYFLNEKGQILLAFIIQEQLSALAFGP
tara:strand:+ start:819 stop:983 length:165 start_codon:yes stop_codon:yes gene_type:complete